MTEEELVQYCAGWTTQEKNFYFDIVTGGASSCAFRRHALAMNEIDADGNPILSEDGEPAQG